MKTTTTLIAALASLAMLLSVARASGQYKATGDDGITASPKYRQQLNEYKKNHTREAAPAKEAVMACPACKDKVTRRMDTDARGANKPAILVTTHLCKACGTDWTVVGHGKTKESVATHKCTSCGADDAACCNTNGKATKGMEKKTTPLK